VRDLSRPLEECLQAMQDKRNLQDILRRYPAERDELIGLLRLSVDLGNLGAPTPDPAFRLHARNKMLALAAERRQSVQHNPFAFLSRPAMRLAVAGAFAVALLVGGLTAAAASERSLPGDPLYGVKLGVERAQLAVTFDSSARAHLQLRFAEVRLDEAQQLFAIGRTQDGVKLVGQYDVAMAQFHKSVASTELDDRTVSELSRYFEDRQTRADASLNALAGSLSARGDADSAAIVSRTQSHVDQALRGSKQDLQAHQSAGQQTKSTAKPVGVER
jgi:hypothetical protein